MREARSSTENDADARLQKHRCELLGSALYPRYSRFLRIALNSTSELEYHLLAARDLGALRASDSLTLISQVVEVRKMF